MWVVALARDRIWGEEALQPKQSLKGLMAGGFLLIPVSTARATNFLVKGEGSGEHTPAFTTENIITPTSPTSLISLPRPITNLFSCHIESLPSWFLIY